MPGPASNAALRGPIRSAGARDARRPPRKLISRLRAFRHHPRLRPLLSALLGLLPLVLWPPVDAAAHGRSVSYSSWALTEDGARVQVRIALLELTRLGIPLPGVAGPGREGSDDPVGTYLADRLDLLVDGTACRRDAAPTHRQDEQGFAVYRWSLTCEASGERRIRSRILLDRAPSHLHFARLTLPAADGRPARILERVLTEADPDWTLPGPGAADIDPAESAGTSLTGYGALGIEHILTGWDHLAFVLALVLLAGSLGEVARLVTGFTIAHSITLALATLRWVEPQTGPVEAVIGFSVALIAAENAWLLGGRGLTIPALATAGLLVLALLAAAGIGTLPVLALLGLALFTASHFGLLGTARDPGRLRVLLAFAFGLVHGFGFAGVLAEMSLPTERLAAALLGFNVGVEIGQLAVVAVLWPVLVWLESVRGGRPHRLVADVAGAAVCGVGLFWFLTRTFGAGAP